MTRASKTAASASTPGSGVATAEPTATIAVEIRVDRRISAAFQPRRNFLHRLKF